MARKSKKQATPTVSLTLPERLLARLDEWATRERRARSNAAALLLEQALDAQAAKAAS